MKLKLSKIVAILAVMAILATLLFSCSPSAALKEPTDEEYEKIYEMENPILELDRLGRFDILLLSDLLLTGTESEDDINTLKGIEDILEAAKHDDDPYHLVVLNGNTFSDQKHTLGYSKYVAIQKLADLFGRYEQKWTFVNGEKDGAILGSSKAIIYECSQYPGFVIADTPNLLGAGNFFIILNNMYGEEKHRIIFIDSGRLDSDNTLLPVDQTQITWAKGVMQETQNKFIFSSIITHSPVNEYSVAFSNGTKISYANGNGFDMFDGLINAPAENDSLYIAVKNASYNGLLVAASEGSEFLRYYDDMYWFLTRSAGYASISTLPRGAATLTVESYPQAVRDKYWFGRKDFVTTD
jgi:hypothetical protein